ncbi:acyltransferase family protein [Algoriphagus namhaensis]|uniref:Acyltransferase family protein n=1 Tax=Algoriphagus namhaensis TaxID=915353 RepID=A0ABV8AT74_9BACT
MSLFQNLKSELIRKPNSGKHLPFVDGLRFLAIVPVIFQHANERLFKYGNLPELKGWEEQVSFLISRGTIGVFIFFAISGFILSLPFSRENSKLNYKTYLKRRWQRIEPPFIFWMTCCALILLVMQAYPIGELLWHYLATVTYTHQLFYQEYSIINPVAWSLEVEIQFYLLAPFFAFAYFQVRSLAKRRSLLIAGIFGWILLQHGMGWHLQPWKATLLGQLPHFLVGVLAADLYQKPVKWIRDFRFWDLVFSLLLLTLAYTWTEELGKTFLFELSLLGLLLSAIYGRYTSRILSLSWISIIGGMCYTLYLMHLPLLEGYYSFIARFGQWSGYIGQLSISLIIVLPIIFLCSVIAFRWIEQPFMKKKDQKSLRSNPIGKQVLSKA